MTLKEQLIQIIKDEIEAGNYKEGDLLPREIDYQNTYGISRITVRGAMATLENEGYIKRIKGKGTILMRSKIAEPLLKIEGFTEEMKQKGIIPTTKDATIDLIQADERCSEALGVPLGANVYELKRIRLMNGIPVAYFKTYMPETVGLILDDQLYQASFYDYLKAHHQLSIEKIKQYMGASLATPEVADLLQCDAGAPLLTLRRIGYSEALAEYPIEYTVAHYVAERYEYYFELEH